MSDSAAMRSEGSDVVRGVEYQRAQTEIGVTQLRAEAETRVVELSAILAAAQAAARQREADLRASFHAEEISWGVEREAFARRQEEFASTAREAIAARAFMEAQIQGIRDEADVAFSRQKEQWDADRAALPATHERLMA